jgi:ABC-2 type transport system ATP-binding protein
MAPMNRAAVQIENLCFHHPGQSRNFFSHLNLEVSEGERFGVFGPNGAGKTTLMYLMTGISAIQQGSIKLFGKPLQKRNRSLRALFGFVPQDFSFYQELSPSENLAFFGSWAGLDRRQIRARSSELLEILGLTDVRHRAVQHFSGGMKRRVNLAIAVLHDPPILFLDEPTVGVDVQTRHAIIDYLKQLNAKGTTLIYTSHQLNEAQDLCERIALMDEGKIIVHDDMDRLLLEHRQDGLEGLYLDLTGKAYRD